MNPTTDISLAWQIESLIALVILTLPMLSFLMLVFLPNQFARLGSIMSTCLVAITTILSVYLLAEIGSGETTIHSRSVWFTVGSAGALTYGVMLSKYVVYMLITVNLVSTLVHIYSLAYMKGDTRYKTYYACLGLFTFSMLGVVMSDNLIIMFAFWELVGLSSYLLIGHWRERAEAGKAASKAFIVNRIADVGFVIALCIVWFQFGTFDLEIISQAVASSQLTDGLWIFDNSSMPAPWLTILGLCLLLGAMGKSAQFPLQIWLPDAMEGPTPVSALIHAATMVAAGIFMISRVFAILNIEALEVMAIIGAITALMGAVAALSQHDIKKVLAFSTISQLGYMLMGMGVGAYDAALFHLFTHAFFKAALFLAAGSVIHSLHHDGHKFDLQDMRNMGGLRKQLPVTFIVYVIATFSLIGVPLFSGFLSKDALLSGSLGWAQVMSGGEFSFVYLVPIIAFITVVLTAFYMTRQILLVFFGEFRAAKFNMDLLSIKESSMGIKAVFIILGVLSLGVVWSLNPFSIEGSWFLSNLSIPDLAVPGLPKGWQMSLAEATHDSHVVASIISLIMILIGCTIAWTKYKPTGQFAKNYSSFSSSSFLNEFAINNWYLDAIYSSVIVKPFLLFAKVLQSIEKRVIDAFINLLGIAGVIASFIVGWFDRAIVDGIVNFSVFFAGRVGILTKSLQAGRIQGFILTALLALLFIIWIILF